MARACTICQHPDLYEINAALVEGVSLRKLEERYGVKRSSLSRHQGRHPLHFGYEPPREITREDFYKYLWQFSVKCGRAQLLYCPLCKPAYPSAGLAMNHLLCDECGFHSLELLAEQLGFELIPFYGCKEKHKASLAESDAYLTEILRRYNKLLETGKPFHLPRKKRDNS